VIMDNFHRSRFLIRVANTSMGAIISDYLLLIVASATMTTEPCQYFDWLLTAETHS